MPQILSKILQKVQKLVFRELEEKRTRPAQQPILPLQASMEIISKLLKKW